MRMWMVDPSLLCRQHLLGEHFELHCIVGDMENGGNWTEKLINSGYVELHNVSTRHDRLVAEMENRGYNHNSPLVFEWDIVVGGVDVYRSLADLVDRCIECKRRIEDANFVLSRV